MANLRISELDFDTIKSNLKDFLKNYTDDDGAPHFTDFDFEGSGISILLDLLSYNTHYNAYLANMVVNEMFLDSAVKRASVVSLAKHLGYTPVSVRGSKATISFTVTNPTNTPNFLTLEKYTPFTTTINDNSYTFVNLNPITIQPSSGVYNFNNVEIVEGIALSYTYTAYTPGPAEKYAIPNNNVDTSTIQVIVQNSVSDTTQTVYTLSEDTLGVDGTSLVYFLEETTNGFFQIYFGDGIYGKKLSRNNVITITYLVSSGTAGNVSGTIAQQFSCGTTVGGGNVNGTIPAVINSRGGGDGENIESIRFRAPRYASSLNRAVTSADYKALIEKNFPLVESVSVWGGEDNVPPLYGKVVISLKPYEGYEITQSTRDQIKNIVLQSRQMLTVTPEFVVPEYLYVNINTTVKYNATTSVVSSTDIRNLITNKIQTYFSTSLNQFNKSFVYSKLSKDIDGVADSIIGNLLAIKLQRRVVPIIGASNNYSSDNSIQFKNGIQPGTIKSTQFIVNDRTIVRNAVIRDIPNDLKPNLLGEGTLQLIDVNTNNIINAAYGSVNYGTGTVSIPSISLLGFVADSTDLRINATVQESYLNIASSKNLIILLDDSTQNILASREQGLTVNVIAA
jgi:hypothetical protein